MMEITENRNGGFLVLSLSGAMDSKAASDLDARALEWLAAGERRFIVDLAALESLSGAGLRVLLVLARKLAGTGGKLALCSPSERVKAVFEVAGFTSAFTIRASQAEAIASAPTAGPGPGALEAAARLLGLSRDEQQPASGDPVLAVRAARLLGASVPDAPAGGS